MAEDFNTSSLVIPGTYIRVRAEALISVGGVSSGNIGIVGTVPAPAQNESLPGTQTLSDFQTALGIFGPSDDFSDHKVNLTRGLEVLFRNGASTVFARPVATGATPTDFANAFSEL